MSRKIVVNRGDQFGRLKILREVSIVGKPRRFSCKCSCGTKTEADLAHLRHGKIESCGCLNRERCAESVRKRSTTHGYSNHRLYKVLDGMLRRCHNSNAEDYHLYGGRGIEVCKKWQKDKQAFIEWALANGYSEGLEIDRRDNDKGYRPSNCRWVTKKVNNRNRRNNHLIKIKGEVLPLVAAIEKHSPPCLSYGTVSARISKGWKPIRALTKPLQIKRDSHVD